MPKNYGKTTSGIEITDELIERVGAKAEAGYDVDKLQPRMKRGRPPIGDGPTEIVQVRLDSRLRNAVTSRAEHDGMNTSEVVREALRRYLAS